MEKLLISEFCCKFCGKVCKNLNSLRQHEIRCKLNSNRRDFDKLAKFSKENLKGKTKYTSDVVRKSSDSLRLKYVNGYISPKKGIKLSVTYLYDKHNDEEISKWINYLHTCHINIPKYELCKSKLSGYSVVSKKYKKFGNTIKPILEHDFIANCVLDGDLHDENTVHHIDSDITNNIIYNLMVFKTNADHKRYHNSKFAYLIYDENDHKFSCCLQK